MRRDILDNTVNLDDMFKSEEKIEPTVVGGAMGMEPIEIEPVDEVVSFDIDTVLEEWSYRCASGFPTYGKTEDMLHLQSILDERNVPLPFERITEEPKFVSDVELIGRDFGKLYNAMSSYTKKKQFSTFIDDMPTALRKEFGNTVRSLTPSEFKLFVSKFKTLKSVEDLNNVSYKPYQKLWDTYVGQAIGKGELFISFMVDGAVVQGSTESYDIGDKGKKYEVKSLDVLSSKTGKVVAGNIRPGAEGKASRFKYTKQLMDFFDILIALKEPEIRANLLTIGDKKSMERIVTVVDSVRTIKPKSQQLVTLSPGDVPMSMWPPVYAAVKVLNKLKSTPVNKNMSTSRIAVKGSGADAQYWIRPEDIKNIAKAAGKQTDINIQVGMPVTDETRDAKILLSNLFTHPFVTNPTSFVNGLSEIKAAFFGDKDGLVYFFKGVTYVSRDMSEFATLESSQDGYRFTLKSRHPDAEYIQDQP
jgi:hypothetical protein